MLITSDEINTILRRFSTVLTVELKKFAQKPHRGFEVVIFITIFRVLKKLYAVFKFILI